MCFSRFIFLKIYSTCYYLPQTFVLLYVYRLFNLHLFFIYTCSFQGLIGFGPNIDYGALLRTKACFNVASNKTNLRFAISRVFGGQTLCVLLFLDEVVKFYPLFTSHRAILGI